MHRASAFLFAFFFASLSFAAEPATIATKTAGLQKLDGFFPLYWDSKAGTLFMEIPKLDSEVLYVGSLAAGLGSNDIGLDRGQLGRESVVVFRRIGPKVLMIEPNQSYRATSDNADERLAVEEAFASSALWGFTVAAETGGRVLVEMNDFLLRDTHNVARRLEPAKYSVDKSRSAVWMPRTKAFPKNTEIEALLTFTTDNAQGSRVGDVAPTASAVTLRLHHAFVELPDARYEPRAYDPRSGFFGISYADYSTPLGEPMVKRFIARHRLEKKDPTAAASDPVEPIVYYVDRGTPEPIRSALVEGAQWWNQAFEAAGYRNAFRVEVAPAGIDPLDIRYNFIQWVHRSTRGWAYGSTVTDPRTGEIIKGHVSLDSLRARQDILIFEGLLAPYPSGDERPAELTATAIARIRQLSAHEVGHTLGLNHNYYDSEKGRISVMDYPHPLVQLRADGSIDVSDAYAVGIGAWDKSAITWGYQDFPSGADERTALHQILRRAWADDLRFMTNQDLGLHPRSDQWANGTDSVAELERVMALRRAALKRFGENVLRRDQPLATMEEALVPLFLHHRYQVTAAASALGGQSYSYSLRGDDQPALERVPAAVQRKAIDTLLGTLAPAELAIPRAVLQKLPPRPPGFDRHRELFTGQTGAAFDPLAPALAAAEITLGELLQPERAARMVVQHVIDPALPGFEEVTDKLVAFAFDAPAADAYEREVRRSVRRAVVEELMALAASGAVAQVRAVALDAIRSIQTRAKAAGGSFDTLLAGDIERFLERPAEPQKPLPAPQVPPGAPIG